MAKYSLQDIRQSHTQKKQFDSQFPFSAWVVRPLSFYSAWMLLQITESPSRIAFAGLVIGMAGCFFLTQIAEWTIWPGLILLLLYDLLDATDGNVARVTGNVSYYGKFLDGAIGNLIEGTYALWMGVGMYRLYQDQAWIGWPGPAGYALGMLVAGATITWTTMYSSLVRDAYYGHYEAAQRLSAPGQKKDALRQEIETSTFSRSPWYLLHLNASSFDIQLLVLLICSVARRVDLFLLGYAAYFVLQAFGYLAFYVRRAQRNLI